MLGAANEVGYPNPQPVMPAGFSVEGVVKESAVLRKGGMQVGQALILTKPIGTGVLLASAMQGVAKGRWLAGETLTRQPKKPHTHVFTSHMVVTVHSVAVSPLYL